MPSRSTRSLTSCNHRLELGALGVPASGRAAVRAETASAGRVEGLEYPLALIGEKLIVRALEASLGGLRQDRLLDAGIGGNGGEDGVQGAALGPVETQLRRCLWVTVTRI